jgi:hypothetical protein
MSRYPPSLTQKVVKMPLHGPSDKRSRHGSRVPTAPHPAPEDWDQEGGFINPQILSVQHSLDQNVATYSSSVSSLFPTAHAVSSYAAWQYPIDEPYQDSMNPQMPYHPVSGAPSLAEGA